MNNFNDIIKKIGIDLGIKVTVFPDGWLKILEKNNETHYITGYQFDLNNHGIGNIMDDKGLFWEALKYKKLPIIEQHIIFKNYDKNEIINYFNMHNREIIVKGNIGNAGHEVFKVNNQYELFKIIDKLFLKEYSISLCPYYNIKNEYRVVVLNNTVRVIFGKTKPVIYGDGKKSVKELAKEYDYYQKREEEIINPNYIPKKNEEVELSFKFNLSSGGKVFLNIKDDLKNKIMNLALIVTKTLNITFASVDIIYTNDNELLVLEANSGVTLNKFILQNDNGYKIAYDIYRDAIKLMFKE